VPADPMPTAISWVVEFVSRVSGIVILATIFVYSELYQVPMKEAQYRADLLQQRHDYTQMLEQMDARDSKALAELQEHCEASIQQNTRIVQRNQELLQELLNVHVQTQTRSRVR